MEHNCWNWFNVCHHVMFSRILCLTQLYIYCGLCTCFGPVWIIVRMLYKTLKIKVECTQHNFPNSGTVTREEYFSQCRGQYFISLSVSHKCILASLRILRYIFAVVPAALNTLRQTTLHFDFLHMDFPPLVHSTSSVCFGGLLCLILHLPNDLSFHSFLTFLFPLYKCCQFFFANHLAIPLQSFSFYHFAWSTSTGCSLLDYWTTKESFSRRHAISAALLT
jgi:hypothetical protein